MVSQGKQTMVLDLGRAALAAQETLWIESHGLCERFAQCCSALWLKALI